MNVTEAPDATDAVPSERPVARFSLYPGAMLESVRSVSSRAMGWAKSWWSGKQAQEEEQAAAASMHQAEDEDDDDETDDVEVGSPTRLQHVAHIDPKSEFGDV